MHRQVDADSVFSASSLAAGIANITLRNTLLHSIQQAIHCWHWTKQQYNSANDEETALSQNKNAEMWIQLYIMIKTQGTRCTAYTCTHMQCTMLDKAAMTCSHETVDLLGLLTRPNLTFGRRHWKCRRWCHLPYAWAARDNIGFSLNSRRRHSIFCSFLMFHMTTCCSKDMLLIPARGVSV